MLRRRSTRPTRYLEDNTVTATTQCRLCGSTSSLHDAGEHGEYRICSPCWEIVASVVQRATARLEQRIATLEQNAAATDYDRTEIADAAIYDANIAQWRKEQEATIPIYTAEPADDAKAEAASSAPPDEEVISETLGYYDAAYQSARNALGEALAEDAPHLLPLFDAMGRSVVEVLHAYAHVAVSGEIHHDKVWDYLNRAEEVLAEVLKNWD